MQLSFEVLRLMRTIRIVRVVRLIRVLRFFRPLRLLVASIAGSLKSLIYALCLLCMIMDSFGIVFTEAANDMIRESELDDRELETLERYYGTVPRATFSLFKSISGGEDWGALIKPLSFSGQHFLYVTLFIGYISFTYFAVLNVMTGVFCHNAIEMAEKDSELLVHQLLRDKDAISEWLRSIFEDKLDISHNGSVTLQDFEQHLRDPQLKAWFASIDLEFEDGWTLFKFLDQRKSGLVCIEDFVQGCCQLRGHAKKIDIERIVYDQQTMLACMHMMMNANGLGDTKGVDRSVDAHLRSLHSRLSVVSHAGSRLWGLPGH